MGDALEALRGVARDLPIEDPRSFQKGLKSLERADWDSGDALIRRALKISDPELERQLERVEALFQQEQPAGAAQLLREIIERHEAYPDLHYMLARAEAELGHHDDALASLARALELNPDFHAARIQFARVLDSVGMRNPAAEQLGLVLQQEPGHRQALDLERDWSGRGHRTPARLAAHADPDPEVRRRPRHSGPLVHPARPRLGSRKVLLTVHPVRHTLGVFSGPLVSHMPLREARPWPVAPSSGSTM